METSRQGLRRSSSFPGPFPERPGLPWEMDARTDFQVSAPMPARISGRVTGDREMTEELGDGAGKAAPPPPGSSRKASKRSQERTQPINLARLAPPSPAEPPASGPRGDPPTARASRKTVKPPKPRPPRTGVAPGDVLCGRYVIEEKVAHCGMAHVYRALDRHRQRAGASMPRVALKFPRRSVGNGSETATLLRQEFLKLTDLSHPNIVSVFDIARDDDLEFIVMEWLSGETLGDLLARMTARRIALDKALEIVRSTARALAHAHELGIVHGDVKPSNIFLASSRTVKLLDFGSGTSSGGDAERNWATRAYASSEVLQGNPPQPHDDVFALGVTAYCLLSGERPFGDLDAFAARARNARPQPLPEDAAERWPAVRHALAFDGSDRPANAGLFLQEFENARHGGRYETAGGSPAVAYGALTATVLASVVWWSVQGIGGLPAEAELALADANRALAEGRLVEPQDASAWTLYSEVLEIQPGNRLAQDGLEEIGERLLERAREAVVANDIETALAELALAREVNPDHFGIAMVEDLIVSRGRDALMRARRAVETDVPRAEALLAEAEAILPADYPELAGVRAEIAAQRIENRVGALLRELDERILAERLTVPTGDSARDLLRKARALAPDDPRIDVAADRVLTALVFQAMFATANGDLDGAEHYLGLARGMGMRHLALARAEYELAKARRSALLSRTDR